MKRITSIIAVLCAVFLIAGCGQNASSDDHQKSGAAQQNKKEDTQSNTSSNSSGSQANKGADGSSAADKSAANATGGIGQSSGSGSVENSTGQTKTSNAQTPEQVIQNVRKQLKTTLVVKLPHALPLAAGKHLTALTTSAANSYTVTFFQTTKPVAINDPSLKKGTGVKIAVIAATGYASSDQAENKIGFEKLDQSSGEPVNLGHKITGYADAGAGTAGVSWNEGRWLLMALSPTSQASQGRALAKQTVNFLETHTLPIPHQYGAVKVYTDNRENYVQWQDNRTVYTLNGIKTPADLLKAATSIK